jgi:hypothetical protein
VGFFVNPKERAEYWSARAIRSFSHASALSKLADISHCDNGAEKLAALAAPGGSIKYQPRATRAFVHHFHSRCDFIFDNLNLALSAALWLA